MAKREGSLWCDRVKADAADPSAMGRATGRNPSFVRRGWQGRNQQSRRLCRAPVASPSTAPARSRVAVSARWT